MYAVSEVPVSRRKLRIVQRDQHVTLADISGAAQVLRGRRRPPSCVRRTSRVESQPTMSHSEHFSSESSVPVDMSTPTTAGTGNIVEVIDNKAITLWGRPSLTVYNSDGLAIAVIPLRWTKRIAPTYGRLGEVIEPMFEGEAGPLEDDGTPLQWQSLLDGRLIANEEEVVAGDHVLRRSGIGSALIPSFSSSLSKKRTRSGTPSTSPAQSDASDSMSEKSFSVSYNAMIRMLTAPGVSRRFREARLQMRRHRRPGECRGRSPRLGKR